MTDPTKESVGLLADKYFDLGNAMSAKFCQTDEEILLANRGLLDVAKVLATYADESVGIHKAIVARIFPFLFGLIAVDFGHEEANRFFDMMHEKMREVDQ